jgi:hypothetical protein
MKIIYTNLEKIKMTKKRCPNCKKYNQTESALKVNISYFCNIDCATSYAFKNKEKGRQIKHKQEKKEHQQSDLKIRKAAAIKACHAYIKQRDLGRNCITCDRSLIGKYDSGHFLKAGNHSYTMFMEKNIHSQCVNCNQYNGGKEKEYKEALILKYGLKTVEALERVRNRHIKRTAQDYRDIENYYKEKTKKLTR